MDGRTDLSPLRGLRVITINDSWIYYPKADVFYFCDPRWWTEQYGANCRSVDGTVTFRELLASGFWVRGTCDEVSCDPRLHELAFTGQVGLERKPDGLRHGSNSGYQAIGLARHFGAKRIVLLGYDMRVVNGRTHGHNGSRNPAAVFAQTLKHSMLPFFPLLVKPLREEGIEVVNATPGSALRCWPLTSLEEAVRGETT